MKLNREDVLVICLGRVSTGGRSSSGEGGSSGDVGGRGGGDDGGGGGGGGRAGSGGRLEFFSSSVSFASEALGGEDDIPFSLGKSQGNRFANLGSAADGGV